MLRVFRLLLRRSECCSLIENGEVGYLIGIIGSWQKRRGVQSHLYTAAVYPFLWRDRHLYFCDGWSYVWGCSCWICSGLLWWVVLLTWGRGAACITIRTGETSICWRMETSYQAVEFVDLRRHDSLSQCSERWSDSWGIGIYNEYLEIGVGGLWSHHQITSARIMRGGEVAQRALGVQVYTFSWTENRFISYDRQSISRPSAPIIWTSWSVFSFHPLRAASTIVAASSSTHKQDLVPIIHPMKSRGLLISFDVTKPDLTIKVSQRHFVASLVAKPSIFTSACPFTDL